MKTVYIETSTPSYSSAQPTYSAPGMKAESQMSAIPGGSEYPYHINTYKRQEMDTHFVK